MKHLLIYTDSSGIFGAEQINHQLALGFQESGYQVSFAQPFAQNWLIEARNARGINHHWLPKEHLYDLSQDAPSLTDSATPREIILEVNADLVLFADGCPLSNLGAKVFCSENDVKFIVLVHCVTPGWASDWAQHLPCLASCYRSAREVIAVCTNNLELLREYFHLEQKKGRVIFNGRPAEFFNPLDQSRRERTRADLGLEDKDILCLSIGRIEVVKGFQYQIEAFSQLQACPHWDQLQFLWIGDGSWRRKLTGWGRLNSRGKLTHYKQRKDIAALMDAADILLHPAQFEGMPLVVLDAMALGLPVVATSVSGIPEALGEHGVLLPAPDECEGMSEHIADAICSLAGDASRRKCMAQGAALRAREFFTEARMLSRYMDCVATVMAES